VRLLLDNNILVSGLISTTGAPSRVADAWRDQRFELITSREQLLRLGEVLARPKIRKLVQEHLAAKLIADLEAAAILVEPDRTVVATSDSEDNLILGAALAGRVDMVVSGDKKHLLSLGHFKGIRIVTAAEALQQLEAG
jgi:putative PIN family toxin of toxin-antitoxin system